MEYTTPMLQDSTRSIIHTQRDNGHDYKKEEGGEVQNFETPSEGSSHQKVGKIM